MKVEPIHTKKILPNDNLEQILNEAFPSLSENSIVVVSAKIVSICEGNVVPNNGTINKKDLVAKEADYFILDKQKYDKQKMVLSIKNDIFVPSAGIDESNANGLFILWPKDPMRSAEKIWTYLREKYNVKNLGVILSDSYFVPLRRGAVGVGIAWCGFMPITNYIGKPDIFGRTLEVTTASRVDGLAAAAEVTMGEGAEQTPLALITDVPFVEFVDRPPTKEEISFMHITKEDDSYGILLNAVEWKKGEKPTNT